MLEQLLEGLGPGLARRDRLVLLAIADLYEERGDAEMGQAFRHVHAQGWWPNASCRFNTPRRIHHTFYWVRETERSSSRAAIPNHLFVLLPESFGQFFVRFPTRAEALVALAWAVVQLTQQGRSSCD